MGKLKTVLMELCPILTFTYTCSIFNVQSDEIRSSFVGPPKRPNHFNLTTAGGRAGRAEGQGLRGPAQEARHQVHRGEADRHRVPG